MPLPEKALIARLRRRTGAGGKLVVGLGDDCAVLRIPAGHETLVTTDFSLEGIHFRREWHPPDAVGHRCLARGLSDIAAMGGEPIAAFLSLALPTTAPQAWVDAFFNGLLNLAKKHRVTLAGGDTAQSPGPILADIVVLGSAPRGKAVLRSGARAGDLVCVTGELGASAAAISDLRAGRGVKQVQREYPCHFYPRPRLEIARFLRERRLVTSMIDISDGLSTDLDHNCEESGVGAEVDAEVIPRASAGKRGRLVDLGFALHGGEDYELLFTAPADADVPARIAGVKISRIGKITRTPGMKLRLSNGKLQNLRPEGWQHFKFRRI